MPSETSIIAPASVYSGILITRGVIRALTQLGWSALSEVTLANGRRADILALDRKGSVAIVEVKSSVDDYRNDRKWPEYGEFCDMFYFAVPIRFPLELIPDSCGLIAADSFSAEIIR